MIKPLVKNNDLKNKNFNHGAFKAVKLSGIMINCDENKNIKTIKRIVSVSDLPTTTITQHNITEKKKEKRIALIDQSLLNDGFRSLKFMDNQTSRTVYIKKYLGNELNNDFLKSLDSAKRKNICQQIINQFNWDTYDLKFANILYENDEVHLIDTTQKALSYFTKTCNKELFYDKNCSINMVKQQQILSLIVTLYFIMSPDEILPINALREQDLSKKIELPLGQQLTFATEFMDAYAERVLPEDLLKKIKNTLNNL